MHDRRLPEMVSSIWECTVCFGLLTVCVYVHACVSKVFFRVNWWHNAWQMAVRRAHRNLHVCVSVRHQSSPSRPNPAWRDLQRTGLEEEGSPGGSPRGRSPSADKEGGRGDRIQMGRRSSSSYPLYTPGFYVRHTEAEQPAERSGTSYFQQRRNGRSQTPTLNGDWSEYRWYFLSRHPHQCGKGHKCLEAVDWWIGLLQS